jgi:hypothetical protein
LTAIISSK